MTDTPRTEAELLSIFANGQGANAIMVALDTGPTISVREDQVNAE